MCGLSYWRIFYFWRVCLHTLFLGKFTIFWENYVNIYVRYHNYKVMQIRWKKVSLLNFASFQLPQLVQQHGMLILSDRPHHPRCRCCWCLLFDPRNLYLLWLWKSGRTIRAFGVWRQIWTEASFGYTQARASFAANGVGWLACVWPA